MRKCEKRRNARRIDIAVRKEKTAREIGKMLADCGQVEEKIVWEKPGKFQYGE